MDGLDRALKRTVRHEEEIPTAGLGDSTIYYQAGLDVSMLVTVLGFGRVEPSVMTLANNNDCEFRYLRAFGMGVVEILDALADFGKLEAQYCIVLALGHSVSIDDNVFWRIAPPPKLKA